MNPDFSVLQFRLDFMRVFGRYPMKSHRNQWLVMPLHAPKVPYKALISPQAILYEGYQPSYGQYVTCFLKGCAYNPLNKFHGVSAGNRRQYWVKSQCGKVS